MVSKQSHRSGRRNRATTVVSVVFLAALAGFFRFYRLHTLPLGLYLDEGMNGNEALRALRTGSWRIFYPENGGREGLFINLQALSIRLFGATPWALRAVSALLRVLTVIGLYLLVRDLYGEWRALIAGVLQAVLIWPVISSRFGLSPEMAAALVVWTLWALVRALEMTQPIRQKSILWAALAGVFLGLGLNSYIAFRAVPLLVVGVVVIALSIRHTNRLRSLTAIAAGCIVLISPLYAHFVFNPQDFFRHAAQESVFARPDLLPFLFKNIFRFVRMFFYHGDMNWRQNFGGAAMISAIVLPFFLWATVDMVRALRSAIRNRAIQVAWRELLLFLWVAIGSLPGLFAGEFPHGTHLILIAPAISLIAANGLMRLYDWIGTRSVRALHPAVVVGCILAVLATYNFKHYFDDYANSPEMKRMMLYSQYLLARDLEANNPAKRRYIVVPEDSKSAYGVPLPAQGLAFLTSTFDVASQERKNIHYAYMGSITLSDSVEVIVLPDVEHAIPAQ